MTELGLLPVEWRTGYLKDVCQIQVGFPYDSEGFSDRPSQESIPIIRIRDLLAGEAHTYYSGPSISDTLDTYLVRQGDILVGMDGNFHVACWKGSDGLLNQRIARLKGFSSDTCWGYIFYAVITPIKRIEDSKHYTTVKHLSMGDLRELSIPLPPLGEQKAITRVLSTIQRAIEAQDKMIAAARELKKSLMRHLFTYGRVPTADAEKVSLKETEIGPVPQHWEIARLGDVAAVKYGKSNPKTEGDIPVVGSGGIYAKTRSALADCSTLVIGRKGTAGEVWLCEGPCWPSDTTFYLVWKCELNVKYVFAYISSHKLSGEHAKTTLPSLQKHELQNSLLPIAPISEQLEIASILSHVERKIETDEKRKGALQTLFQTMLHNLMTGKLRVTDLEGTGE